MPDGSAAYRVDAADAFVMAVRNQIEAIVSPAGKLRYFRFLPTALTEAINEQDGSSADDIDTGTATAFARTKMGAFREHLREARVEVVDGVRRVVEEGGVVGFCYSHCGASDKAA